jgi:hypothetical protein
MNNVANQKTKLDKEQDIKLERQHHKMNRRQQ